MEKESINGGGTGQRPGMEIAFKEGEKLLPYTGAKRQGGYECVCVCVVGFMCEVEDVPFCHLFFLLEEGSKAIS